MVFAVFAVLSLPPMSMVFVPVVSVVPVLVSLLSVELFGEPLPESVFNLLPLFPIFFGPVLIRIILTSVDLKYL